MNPPAHWLTNATMRLKKFYPKKKMAQLKELLAELAKIEQALK